MSVHDEYPEMYDCPFCDRSSRLLGNLKKHFKVHFKDEDERKAAWEQHVGSTYAVNFYSVRQRGTTFSRGKKSVDSENGTSGGTVSRKQRKIVAKKRMGLRVDDGSREWVEKVGNEFATPPVDMKVPCTQSFHCQPSGSA